MNFIVRLLITAAVAYLLSLLLQPHIRIDSYITALVFVMALALLNAIVKPILIILTLPITILTLGIFLLVLNVLMVMLAGRWVNGIEIDGFFWALIFSALLSFLSSILTRLSKPGR